MFFSDICCFACDVQIITVDSPKRYVLKTKTEAIQEDEFFLAREIAKKLFCGLYPYLPAAGLAAPQIGISKSVFIFSFDRDPKNLEVVINPTFEPVTNEKQEEWEACFSVVLSDSVWKIAKVPRYRMIKVIYQNLEGEKIEKILDGFASKVFQHEYDHLQGIENIEREDAVIKEFETKEALEEYVKEIKKIDSLRYKKTNISL